MRVALALPAFAVAAASAALLALALAGRHPLWREEPLNLSEAAAFRDAARVVRLLREGEDVTVRRRVRGGALAAREVLATPLEAAIVSRRPEVLGVLLEEVALDTGTWHDAVCLAQAVGDAEIEALLNQHRPAAAAAGCEGFVRRW